MIRGSIVSIRPVGRGHEQRGPRPGVVVQANDFLALSTVIIAPTSRSAPARSFRPQISIDGGPTRVLVEQLGAFDVQRVGDVLGHVDAEEHRAIEDALLMVLGFG